MRTFILITAITILFLGLFLGVLLFQTYAQTLPGTIDPNLPGGRQYYQERPQIPTYQQPLQPPSGPYVVVPNGNGAMIYDTTPQVPYQGPTYEEAAPPMSTESEEGEEQ